MQIPQVGLQMYPAAVLQTQSKVLGSQIELIGHVTHNPFRFRLSGGMQIGRHNPGTTCSNPGKQIQALLTIYPFLQITQYPFTILPFGQSGFNWQTPFLTE